MVENTAIVEIKCPFIARAISAVETYNVVRIMNIILYIYILLYDYTSTYYTHMIYHIQKIRLQKRYTYLFLAQTLFYWSVNSCSTIKKESIYYYKIMEQLHITN